MASLGDLIIKVGGNIDGFKAAMQDAESSADKLSARIAASASAGVELFDAYGRKFQSTADGTTAAAEKTAAAEAATARAGNQLAESLIRLSGAQELAAATSKSLSAAHGTNLTDIQAISGAIRVTEGSGGIRAAERFLAMIPGLGAIAQVAFPVIGALALYDAFGKLADKSIDLEGKLAALKEATKAADAEFANLTKTVDGINTARLTRDFGNAASLKLKGNLGAEDAQADLDKAKALYTQLDNLRESHRIDNQVNPATGLGILPDVPKFGSDIRRAQKAEEDKLQQEAQGAEAAGLAKSAQVAKDREDMQRAELEESASIGIARVGVESKLNTSIAELARQRTDIWINAERAQKLGVINEQLDAHSRAVAAAQLDIQLAEERASKLGASAYAETQRAKDLARQKAAFDSAGKTPSQRAAIAIDLKGELSGLDARQGQEELRLHEAVLQASAKADEAQVAQQRNITEEIIKDGERRVQAIGKMVDDVIAKENRYLEVMARVSEIAEKSQGTSQAAGFEAEKLQLERAYGLQVVSTGAQQLQQMVKLDALDEKARNAKVEALDAASKTALVAGDLVRWAKLAEEANAGAAENANKTYQSKTRELEAAQKLSLTYRIQESVSRAAQAVPGAVGNSLAKSLIDGKSIGHDIAQSLKGIGQQLLGNIFTRLITTMTTQIAVQTGLITATTTNAGVTTLHSGVLLTHAGVMIAHGAIVIGNTIATIANTVVTIILSTIEAIKAFFGFADGGVPPLNVPSVVGERGPELFIPHQLGTIIPNHKLGALGASGSSAMSSVIASLSSSSSTVTGGNNTFHVHGTNAREIVHQISRHLKLAGGPAFSPA